MSKKLKIMELGGTGKIFLATFLGALLGGKIGKVKALKRKMRKLDDELADELELIHRQVLKDKARYEKAVKDLTPDQKKEFDRTY